MSATPIAIQDAELLPDLLDAGLLGPFFRLSVPFSITEPLWQQLGLRCQRAVQAHLTRQPLPGSAEEAQRRLTAIARQYVGLSLAECSVYHLAQTNAWPMLAMCGSLLRRRYDPYCEVLEPGWLFQQLQAQAQLTRRDAIAAAKRLVAVNPRLRVEQLLSKVN